MIFRARSSGEVVGPNGQRGEWWTQYFDAEGRRHREKAGTKAAATALYQRRKTEVRQGKHFPETMRRNHYATLKVICDDYIDALKTNGRDARGQAKTRLAEVQAILGSIPAKNLMPQDVEKLKARLLNAAARGRKKPDDLGNKRLRAPASVNRYLQDLRAAYNLAQRNSKVERNPVADVQLLPENNKKVREMSAEEERAILTALDASQRRFHTDMRPLVRFLTETGLRLGEACNLCGSDVDWTAEVVTLRKTKAGKVQHVPLSPEAAGILHALGPRDGNAYVFAWSDGRPWTPGYVTHAFRKAANKAGLSDLHVHDLRHTFACRLLRGRVDIYTVSKLLRHATVVMSERYAHLSQADLKAAIAKVSAGKRYSSATSTATDQ